jgi:hypothetical protein
MLFEAVEVSISMQEPMPMLNAKRSGDAIDCAVNG